MTPAWGQELVLNGRRGDPPASAGAHRNGEKKIRRFPKDHGDPGAELKLRDPWGWTTRLVEKKGRNTCGASKPHPSHNGDGCR